MKNYYKILYLLICLFNIISATAQDSSKINILIKTHPLTAMIPDKPAIQVGIEFVFNKKIGLNLSYGKQYLFNEKYDSTLISPSGDRIIIDLRYYNKYKTILPKYKYYYSFSYWYITSNDNYRHKDYGYTIFGNDTIQNEFYKYFAKVEKIHVLSLNYGIIREIKRFSFEASVGCGVRYKTRQIKEIWSYKDSQNYDNSIANGLIGDYPFKGFLPHINFGIRICYRII